MTADTPLDVVQRVLGHASLQTTSTYVTAEQRRVRAEAAKYRATPRRLNSSSAPDRTPGAAQRTVL